MTTFSTTFTPRAVILRTVTVMVGLVTSACHQIGATPYATGYNGSFDILRGKRVVALAHVSQDSAGVRVLVFATGGLPAGQHAVHIHLSCNDTGDIVPGGRLPNIDIPATGIGKLDALITGRQVFEYVGMSLVIHTNKDGGLTSAEMDVGGTVGCGVIARGSPGTSRSAAAGR